MLQQVFVYFVVAVLSHVLLAPILGQTEPCGQKLLKVPRNYEKDTENYYLAWIEHGRPGQRAMASQKLLEVEPKIQYDVTEKLWKCESNNIVKHSLQLALFDHRPDIHLQRVTALFEGIGKPAYGDVIKLEPFDDGSPAPYDRFFKEGVHTLIFSWRLNAALRLMMQGHITDETFEILLNMASDGDLYTVRLEAKKVFDLFEGLPEYSADPKVNRYRYEKVFIVFGPSSGNEKVQKFADYEWYREKQLRAVKKWYSAHRTKLKWDKGTRKYKVMP